MPCMSANHRYCSLWMMPEFSMVSTCQLVHHTHSHAARAPGGSSVIFKIFPNEPSSGFFSERPCLSEIHLVKSRQAV